MLQNSVIATTDETNKKIQTLSEVQWNFPATKTPNNGLLFNGDAIVSRK